MMVPSICKAGIMAIIVGMLLAGICQSAESKESASESESQSPPVVQSEEKQKGEENKESALPFGLIDGMHQVVREERIEALKEIDKERRETLAYLTEERRAVMEELKGELNRTTEILLKERRVTMVEMEIMGNRIVENLMIQSRGLIDHLFIRIVQLLGSIVLAICLIGGVYYLVAVRKKDLGKAASALS